MNKLKCFVLSSSAVAVFGIVSVTIADTPPSTASCEKFLEYSDSQFNTLVSENSNTAQIIATELGECLQFNSCSDISNVNNCSATLASRTFLSNFYANYTNKGGYGAPTPPSGGSNYSSPPSSGGGASNTANAVSSHAPAPSNKATSSSVHWY